MEEVIVSHVSFIPKKFEYLVKKHLEVTSFSFDGKLETWYFYEETDDFFVVPRYFPILIDRQYRLGLNMKHIRYDSEDIEFECYATPRDELQEEAVRFLGDITQQHGIIKAVPGFGKTLSAIMAISKYKKKTLVLVPKKSLAAQWKEEILNYTSLKDEDVPIFQDGVITKDMLDSMKIGIGVSHTFSYKALKKDIDYHKLMKQAKIDTVIYDECHSIIPTQFFFFQNSLLYANRFFGLSATPYHKNPKLMNIIYYTVSDTILDLAKYKIKPKVVELYFKSFIPEKTKKYILWNGRFDIHKYLRMLKKHSETFKTLFVQFVNRVLQSNRYLLVLAPQKNFLQYLKTLILDELDLTEDDIGLFWSGRSKDELKKRIILATTQIFNMGMNVPKLNTLLIIDLFASKKSIEQIMGRILRKAGEKQPLVTILNDLDFEIFREFQKMRTEVYEELGFPYQVTKV